MKQSGLWEIQDGHVILLGSLASPMMKKNGLETVVSMGGILSIILIWLYLVKMRAILKKKTVLIHIMDLFIEVRVYCLNLISPIVLCCDGTLL